MNIFSKLRITHKITALMAGLVFGFIAIGITYYIQVNISDTARAQEKEAFILQQTLSELKQLELNLRFQANQIQEQSASSATAALAQLQAAIDVKISEIRKAPITAQISVDLKTFEATLDEYEAALDRKVSYLASSSYRPNDQFSIEIDKTLIEYQNQLDTIVNGLIATASEILATTVKRSSDLAQATQAAVTAIIFMVAMGAAIGIYFIYKSIVFPMAHMQSVIGRINRGKTKARVKVLTNDELGDLGTAFNQLFDERIDHLETQSKENERLNNSIINLIQALGAIAKKDLRIKVPVSADITGTISDALNLLTQETANTLHKVKNVSNDVDDASQVLQEQSQKVMQFAESERMQILATSKALRVLAGAMAEIASNSERADTAAGQAINSTQSAKKAVVETVNGIRTIRETISETEKRTKRLGERSQEISGIVNLINTIAERTHILALNASMHAASAGEAGKGFAVVAEEVQRLAESARQSTDEISAMVNNMRVETSDTLNIMNKLISQVADGSKLAEHAGKEMETTEEVTRELVDIVKNIATEAVAQAAVANRVKDRATIIRSFSEKTDKQLKEQKIYTDNLRSYSEILLERVNMFKLPQDETAETIDLPSQKISPIKAAV